MITRNIDKARKAFKKKDIHALRAAHDANDGYHKKEGKYIKSVVYGGLDGTITTFAVVSGVAGAALSSNIVLILGFANLIADGISMAVSDYLSTKAEIEYHEAERKREEWEVKHYPEGEKKEMQEIYEEKGMSKEDASTMVSILSKYKRAFVDAMMVHELGLVESEEDPTRNAMATFFSFVFFGFIPLVTYVIARTVPFVAANSFYFASIITGISLFFLGAIKVKITEKNWLYSGTEMLVVGGIAAAAAFWIGRIIAGIV